VSALRESFAVPLKIRATGFTGPSASSAPSADYRLELYFEIKKARHEARL
jgi:hypothetical protein